MTDEFGFTELRQHWAESAEKERAELEPFAHPAMADISRLTSELRNAGWNDIAYCPKDGTVFLAWSPINGPLPYRCSYDGEWPNGSWWACTCGDIWPDRPVLFKPLPQDHSHD